MNVKPTKGRELSCCATAWNECCDHWQAYHNTKMREVLKGVAELICDVSTDQEILDYISEELAKLENENDKA